MASVSYQRRFRGDVQRRDLEATQRVQGASAANGVTARKPVAQTAARCVKVRS